MQILFLLLDELLGEYGTENWIGTIDVGDEQLGDAVPVAELPGIIEAAKETYGWNKPPPPETLSLYKLSDPPGGFLRGDVFVGNTAYTDLINQWLHEKGPIDDPFEGTGADAVFTSITTALLPKGEEVTTRSAIEDAVHERLASEQAGCNIGGATGSECFYSDYLLFDGQRSVDLLREALVPFNLPAGSGIHFFSKKKSRFDLSL